MAHVFGGTLVARTLARAGVTHVFGILGHELLGVYDACLDYGIEVVGTRHESAAVHMADAWARISGQPGVCFFTSGPGHVNAIPGTVSAAMSNSPIILISAASDFSLRDMDALQEIDQVGLMAPATKWARTVTDTRRIPEYIASAYRHALAGRTGPVHLSLPGDVVGRRVDDGPSLDPDPAVFRPGGRTHPDPALVRQAIDLLAQAERPVAIAGSGALWSRADRALAGFAETTQTPVFTLELARGLLSDEHPLCFGYGDPLLNAAARRFADADCILVLGKKIDFRLQYGRPPLFRADARVVQVDVDPTEIGHNRAVDVGIAADVAAALGELANAARSRVWERREWLAELRATQAEQQAALAPLAASDEVPIHPARVAATIRDTVRPDAFLAVDGGDYCHWARMILPARRPAGFLRTFPLASLGLSLPFAIAAKLRHPECQAVAVSGDGALGFYLMEFETALRHGVPVVAVVGNDAAWGIEKHIQQALYGPDRLPGSLLSGTRYDRVVEALGGHGEYVEDPAQLRPAVERALASGRPACVNVRIRGVTSPMAESLIRRKREYAGDGPRLHFDGGTVARLS
ncbi:MAG: thiamine pyrophosphate-binding protein [Chloroflexi bacterium]|nr:thiamine pyrophosphate-binding protein [Chloroflexota bacterium]